MNASLPRLHARTAGRRASTGGFGGDGLPQFLNVFVDGNVSPDAAWTYDAPKEAAAEIQGRIAFWKDVRVVD